MIEHYRARTSPSRVIQHRGVQRNDLVELVGANVLITGGGGGLGKALARAFIEAGSAVTTVDLRDADLELDVTDTAAMATAIAGMSRLDVVVANAGVGFGGFAHEVPVAAWQRTIDVNVSGVVNTVLPAYERMRTQGRGSIVLMASLAGIAATPLLTPYSMSKFAIVGLGANLRPEAALHGVGVTTVCPGPIETPLLDATPCSEGFSVRRYLTAVAGAPLSADAVGAKVVSAVRANRALVVPGRAATLARAARFAPRLTARVIQSAMRREIAHATRSTAST